MRINAAIALRLALPALAAAQEIRGTVRDGVTREPIAGAVVLSLDSASTTIGRGLTNELGEFRVSRSPALHSLRVVRMGYRPNTIVIEPMSTVETRVDMVMTMLPRFLEPVSVAATNACPARTDAPAAFALLEQAREGLLATIVARSVNYGMIKDLVYERTSEGPNERVLHQRVRIDSQAFAMTSFGAVRSAAGFVAQGFMHDSAGTTSYFGPDADVLMDPAFTEGYCFRLRNADKDRPHQVGLGFAAARARTGRVDIDGTLWIDTAARALKDIEFLYAGLPRRAADWRPGGRISFREMPNGSVMIDQWSFRLVAERVDTSTGRDGLESTKTYHYLQESGGEIARAAWTDGRVWDATLGSARIRLVDKQGRPVTRAILRLADTDYLASPDSFGIVRFVDLLPGPYTIAMIDSALVSKNIVLGSTTKFTARRGTLAVLTMVTPSVDAFLKHACNGDVNNRWIEARAIDARKKPVAVQWTLGELLGTTGERVIASGLTERDGVFGFCKDMQTLATLEVRLALVWDPSISWTVELPLQSKTQVTLVAPTHPLQRVELP
jgi:hypothetical protein